MTKPEKPRLKLPEPHYIYRGLIVCIIVMIVTVLQLPKHFVLRSQLTAVTGTPHRADVSIRTVTDDRGHQTNVAELDFELVEHHKKFHLSEHIGIDPLPEKYSRMRNKIRIADTVTVWIRKKEVSDFRPDVYEIVTDGTTILSLKDTTAKYRLIDTLILLGCIAMIVWALKLIFDYKNARERLYQSRAEMEEIFGK